LVALNHLMVPVDMEKFRLNVLPPPHEAVRRINHL
jgi:hypothetical protein